MHIRKPMSFFKVAIVFMRYRDCCMRVDFDFAHLVVGTCRIRDHKALFVTFCMDLMAEEMERTKVPLSLWSKFEMKLGASEKMVGGP
jgi:hypothetical protein